MYSPPPIEEFSASYLTSPERKINQVKQLASNAYELINTLEAMMKTVAEKNVTSEKNFQKRSELLKSHLKELLRTSGLHLNQSLKLSQKSMDQLDLEVFNAFNSDQ